MHARGGCSGRQAAAGPARRAAARPTWRARSVQQKQPQQPAPQRSRWRGRAHRHMRAKRSSVHGQGARDTRRERRMLCVSAQSVALLVCAVRSSGGSCSGRFGCTCVVGGAIKAPDGGGYGESAASAAREQAHRHRCLNVCASSEPRPLCYRRSLSRKACGGWGAEGDVHTP